MNSVVGSWELVGYVIERDDGTTGKAQWGHPCGLLIYTPDGRMSVTMMDQVERPFDAARWWDGNDEEKLAAASTFFGYAGRFQQLEDSVIHRIDVSLFPGWVGRDHVRKADLDGASLTLRDRIAGQDANVALSWRRLSATATVGEPNDPSSKGGRHDS